MARQRVVAGVNRLWPAGTSLATTAKRLYMDRAARRAHSANAAKLAASRRRGGGGGLCACAGNGCRGIALYRHGDKLAALRTSAGAAKSKLYRALPLLAPA